MSRRVLVILAALVVAAGAAGLVVLDVRGSSSAGDAPAAPDVSAATTTAAPATSTTAAATSTSSSTTTSSTTTTTLPPRADCPDAGHGAVIDRDRQQAWLCDGGFQTVVFPITSAISMPDPNTYQVYAKDMNTTSRFGGHFSRMTHFVAFTRGERTGARIAFHSVPTLRNGEYVQPLESVGDPARHGESSGCIRVTPDMAQVIWDWLDIGDTVKVIT